MKVPILILLLTAISGLTSCEKQIDNPDVEAYIDQLKSNSYTATELPEFGPTDIPALLNYRNETMVITDFPHNGISSLWGPECKLGMYVLWTIESIRAVEIESKYLIGRFPSQNPILALRNSNELKLVYDEVSHAKAAKAYYDWWHSIHLIKDKMKIDPLEDTYYRWH
ncbi:MAG: DUF4943 domain-containing protein [Candidatus Atribacteria bacterium]|nr:MAG: DUF4943 domain-containing protein [Candidatus Atribacteria bacterium]